MELDIEKKIRDLKKENIINKLEPYLIEFDIQNITMNEIAKFAKISKRTLYKFFPSKEALYNAFLSRANVYLYEVLYKSTLTNYFASSSPAEQLKTLWEATLEYSQNYLFYFNILIKYKNINFNLDDEYLKKSYFYGEKMIELIKKVFIQFDSNFVKNKNIAIIIDIYWMSALSYISTREAKKEYLKNYHNIKIKDMDDTFFEYTLIPLLGNNVFRDEIP